MKANHFSLLLLTLFGLTACGKQPKLATETTSQSTTATTISETITDQKETEMTLTLSINHETLPVTWENNNTVQNLKTKLTDQSLTVNLSAYGGFEQVGSLGFTLPSQDQQLRATSGDIMLYNSNNIVLFFGSNSWSYTKLGHIDLSQSELDKLLNQDSVSITLSLSDAK
ncbi:cyclophilin-like fold protein [Streptococcus ruminantium]|uniref:Cyclophilin-like fold protein n=1 Tax=Streptococcus ruminantium TaxID=1917441 RepID=A0ABU1B6I6_9STRE|nr:cyclophilin-like fold protein [Streptococcus ruminantium]MDQ8759994.1 cyclophilin-like fold protein [Streptococcus ruminantium]MDQ8765312.1 cyclophilin-like fold protein [Streptococcus ruminantium]MDQ8767791.1 cyclophilin-like fold protein [Streptococcus ruminantium]MDQ8769215.1 cyclophilin-like fold protein [Streptococcus ruminantium]MDQ8775130.1 cyclophilin-like fold protein [Streptococcus ruminantium]